MDRHGGQGRIARNGFRDITATLKDKISGGDLIAGSYLPTERELQIDFGASRTTVRKALAALIESGWAQSIPNRGVVATRGFKPGATSNVAFVHSGSYVSQILLCKMCGLLEPYELNLVALGGRSDYPMDKGLARAVEHEHLGAIVWPNEGFPDVERVTEIARRLPIVAIDHQIPGIQTDLVTFDHEKAAFDATEHLIRQGAKRIGVTGMMDMLDITHQRFRGYLRALFANGLTPDANDFLFTFTSGSEEPDSRVLEQVLRSGNHPDAFFVLNDLCLPCAIASAERAGLSVPSELRFAAIGDDLDIAVGDARMTAIAFDWHALAEGAVRLLTERLADLNRPPQTFVVPHHLKVRGLCGAPREEWTSDSPYSRRSFGQSQVSRVRYVFNSRWGTELSPHRSRSGEILI